MLSGRLNAELDRLVRSPRARGRGPAHVRPDVVGHIVSERAIRTEPWFGESTH
jgi:hypothetical protein